MKSTSKIILLPALGNKCVRCYYIREGTIKIFGDNLCKKCFHIIATLLLNGEFTIETDVLVPIPFSEHKEKTSQEILELLNPYLKEEDNLSDIERYLNAIEGTNSRYAGHGGYAIR